MSTSSPLSRTFEKELTDALDLRRVVPNRAGAFDAPAKSFLCSKKRRSLTTDAVVFDSTPPNHTRSSKYDLFVKCATPADSGLAMLRSEALSLSLLRAAATDTFATGSTTPPRSQGGGGGGISASSSATSLSSLASLSSSSLLRLGASASPYQSPYKNGSNARLSNSSSSSSLSSSSASSSPAQSSATSRVLHVPRVKVAPRVVAGRGCLGLAYVDLSHPRDGPAMERFGEALAALHSCEPGFAVRRAFAEHRYLDTTLPQSSSSPRNESPSRSRPESPDAMVALFCDDAEYGLPADGFIGSSPQRNLPTRADWPGFYAECRLGPQIDLAVSRSHLPHGGRLHRSLIRIRDSTDLFFGPGHGGRPERSLCHGDLCSENYGFEAGTGLPYAFDPAAFVGDPEVDLAALEMFGLPHQEAFFSGYGRGRPLRKGRADRRPLYDLYHWLNHLNMFGEAYEASLAAAVDECTRFLDGQ